MNMKSRINRLEARKGVKKTAIIQLPTDMADEDEVRDAVDRLTADISEPFDEWIIHDHDVTEPVIGWFGDLGTLLEDISTHGTRIGVSS